ncbi:class I SAM-dependent methyltransferase [Methylomonas sp. SURF-2]|uniref:Class I SAM-dependent methyltransferase n=1 Tax=Methylomonas subterranea TaxID=2952225 RepID=A0ABT1TI35_9GAMM|nr:class I SAM-dependent methyltransferase [Methylomonas sp. SURF-2]MCQ8105134.1 class I SAM-dependent methyltransferase [Methylomonas sp. SURF-2]
MPSKTVIKTFCRELLTKQTATRKTEPDLVMDDPEKVAAYTRAGREDGVMAPVYLFHCAQICEIIKPGDTVLDLGCGPATQLAMVARLNPETHFIGMDLSTEMLDKARNYIAQQHLSNIEFQQGDITHLSNLANKSIDAVMSTVVLHHLPNLDQLENTFREISRVLKPDGGLYLVDFGHLKSEKSIHDFAYQYAGRQAELFTLDYLYSLQAAFWPKDFYSLYQKHLSPFGKYYQTFIMPYMMVVKSPSRRNIEPALTKQLRTLRFSMPKYHQTDLKDLILFFRLGGLQSNFLS